MVRCPRDVCLVDHANTLRRRARTLEKQLQQPGSMWDIMSDYAAWALALGTLYGGNVLLADVRAWLVVVCSGVFAVCCVKDTSI